MRSGADEGGCDIAYATAKDGARLYYEETGAGSTVIFVHEFAGDMRSWEPQMRHFGRTYRCISYNARGYPPSDVPPAHTMRRGSLLATMSAFAAH